MTAHEIASALLETDDPDDPESFIRNFVPPRPRAVDISPEVWQDDNKLRALFSWLTRIGLAAKFGTLPVHYYQQSQMRALEKIEAAVRRKGMEPHWVRYANGYILAFHQGKWIKVALVAFGQVQPYG